MVYSKETKELALLNGTALLRTLGYDLTQYVLVRFSFDDNGELAQLEHRLESETDWKVAYP